jgi:hypothetical protein
VENKQRRKPKPLLPTEGRVEFFILVNRKLVIAVLQLFLSSIIACFMVFEITPMPGSGTTKDENDRVAIEDESR